MASDRVECAPGTVLEDKEEDRWTLQEDGSLVLSDGLSCFPNVDELYKAYGPLTVVEEPRAACMCLCPDANVCPKHEPDPVNATYGDDDNLSDHLNGYTTKDYREPLHIAGFETKDSGERQIYSTGMQRDVSTNKPRFDLLIPKGVPYHAQMLTRFAELMMRGAAKYSSRNWELACTDEELDRFKESQLRHTMQWQCGETDEDHAAAIIYNVLAFESTKWKMENK